MSRWPGIEERFSNSYMPVPEAGCWLWEKRIDTRGYGIFRVGGGIRIAHRFSYELHKGPIPDGVFVCHHCDVRCCVNPHHLFLGTNSDNQLDCVRKGRHPGASQTHCKRGHQFDEANTYWYAGARWCRICRHEYQREWRRADKH